ncbi:transcriptional regulator, AsnC family [Tranquillimonas rosea]|uniref:Transcriptional regulator, AsnC family n=1 Tax=Tranquillimonas rosea TaxID=641238 RepID=A0A1H9WEY5_9RHOB|nr:Lrp/AsnC family transcriptional regulator [Tranquillimonas rosea]SES32488.1 transcriptional regulator, AsnC family [Tranquillimonas rosea]
MRDDLDRRLLRHLHADPALTATALARRADTTGAVAARRLERLRADGVIRGRHARIDWRALGFEVEVSLRVTLDKTESGAFDQFIAAARQVREVIEIQTFLGRVDVRLGVIARSMSHYQEIYRDRILALPHIADIEALMHVATLKTESSLPI